jgi:hypothetical protein
MIEITYNQFVILLFIIPKGYLNDLWMYNISSGLWRWINGSPNINMGGIYIREYYGAPGARNEAANWIDNKGNLWLFGGAGYASTEFGILFLLMLFGESKIEEINIFLFIITLFFVC